MSVALPKLFKGIALVIDNEIGKEGQIDEILANIKASGGHYVSMRELPTEDDDLEHFDRIAFLIMDWNLLGEPGLPMTAELEKENVIQNIAFLKRLGKSRHAPVFIFTNNNPSDVQSELEADEELRPSVEDKHILVRRKSEVVGQLYEVLEQQYATSMPSVLTLKTWERAYHKAANQLFIDLHNKTSYWPAIMWETFGADDVPPAFEMARLINRLVEARMEPLDIDLSPFVERVAQIAQENREDYLKSMYSVLEGERFLRDDRLTDGIYAPGDVFCTTVQGGQKVYRMNIRAECDCLHGNDTELYLLKLKKIENAESHIDPHNSRFTAEKDTEAVVHAMFDATTFAVQFKELKIKKVKTIKSEHGVRVGRLLPPFLTRVQQRYAGYLQRPGLPRVPAAMLATNNPPAPDACEAA
jgi:hypothetical protein